MPFREPGNRSVSSTTRNVRALEQATHICLVNPSSAYRSTSLTTTAGASRPPVGQGQRAADDVRGPDRVPDRAPPGGPAGEAVRAVLRAVEGIVVERVLPPSHWIYPATGSLSASRGRAPEA